MNWSHRQLLEYGAFFLVGSVMAFFGSANRKYPWHVRYVAFAIGATAVALGVLIPVSLWNR
jgi:hypothetical protein